MTDKQSVRDATWSQLMGDAGNGDEGAYRRLLSEVTPFIRAIAQRRGLDASARDDLVQDVLLCLHRGRHSYDGARPFLPWLLQIIDRQLIDTYRRNNRSRCVVPISPEMLDDVPAPPEASEFDTNAARAFLAGLINRLPPRQRQAIKLVKLDELTVSEASARTGDTQSAIKLRIHRAIRSLQSTLEAARNAGSMMSMQDFAA